MNTVVGILGDEMRGTDIRRVVPTWSRDRYRNAIDALAGYFKIFALMDHFMDRRSFGRNFHRCNRISFRFSPELVHFSWFAAETDSVNFPVCRENADSDGNL